MWGLGLRGLGFRGLGFRGFGVWGLGFGVIGTLAPIVFIFCIRFN